MLQWHHEQFQLKPDVEHACGWLDGRTEDRASNGACWPPLLLVLQLEGTWDELWREELG